METSDSMDAVPSFDAADQDGSMSPPLEPNPTPSLSFDHVQTMPSTTGKLISATASSGHKFMFRILTVGTPGRTVTSMTVGSPGQSMYLSVIV